MRRLRILLVILAAAGLMTACVGLPSSGPVRSGVEAAPEAEGLVFLASDPRPGDGPEEIVDGFLDAATAGVAERFDTAQKYLTTSASSDWHPGGGVTIYSGSTPPSVEETAPGRVEVTLTVDAYVDEDGVYTEEGPEVEKTVTFALVRDSEQQWRINSLDDGVLMSAVNFGTQYRQVPLYYLSPDSEFYVPDTRWFPQRNSATSAVQALLAGPVDWLAPGVITAFPTGTSADPVTVTEGVAQVNLSEEVLTASVADRELFLDQLQHTLTQLPQVRRVEVNVDQASFAEDVEPSHAKTDPGVGTNPVAIRDDELVTISGGDVNPLSGSVPVEPDRYHQVAMPYDQGPLVALVDDTQLVTIPDEDDGERALLEDDGLVGPSYDRFGWAWTAAQDNDGTMMAVDPVSGSLVFVEASGLEGEEIRSLRVSRDGARIAVITEAEDQVQIQLSAILRDSDGTPVELESGWEVGSEVTLSTDVVWIDDQTLGVLGISDGDTPTVHVLPAGGPSAALTSVPSAASITSGRGEQQLWIADDDGALYTRSGSGWRQIGEDLSVTDPTFPG